jgi:AraC-like DNA-binding protein
VFIEHTSTEVILFFTLYGITGIVPLIAALYLLLRRGNAFAADTTSPLRLRRWAASFFAVSTLAHVWWLLFYLYSGDLNSAGYMVLVIVDCVLLFTTFAGTLLAMLQDRRRSVWPALMATIPFVLLGGAYMFWPNELLLNMTTSYIILLYVLFTGYMVVAIRQYGRWLNDNYADLENKKVWLSQAVALVCMLLFVLYVLATDMVLIWSIHIIELVLVGLLLWRVETLPCLNSRTTPDRPTPLPLPVREGSEYSQDREQEEGLSTPLPIREGQGGGSAVDLDYLSGLLQQHCIDKQLYLQHDLSLLQLAQAVGTNRYYLSQYFSHQGINYNTYINNLRINHFISRYQELAATGRPVVAMELARESGFHSYSTFSRAFMLRTGQSVTAWMRESGNEMP